MSWEPSKKGANWRAQKVGGGQKGQRPEELIEKTRRGGVKIYRVYS